MTIRKGEDWGTQVLAPDNFPLIASDTSAAQMKPGIAFALTGGEVYESLGSPATASAGKLCRQVPIDAINCIVTVPEGALLNLQAFSHVRIGRWFHGRYIAVTNCGYVDGLNTSPRAHVNDGEFDVFAMEAKMPIRQRLLARRKAKNGAHLPHPLLKSTRGRELEIFKISKKEILSVDGQHIKNWTSVTLEIKPDYWLILL